MGEFAQLSAELKQKEAELEERCALLRMEYEGEMARLGAMAEARVRELKDWAVQNKEAFGEAKSLKLLHGIIGFRTGTPSVRTPVDFSVDSVPVAFRRVRVELDKERVLALWRSAVPQDQEKLEELKATCGIRITQTERFYAEAKTEEVAQ